MSACSTGCGGRQRGDVRTEGIIHDKTSTSLTGGSTFLPCTCLTWCFLVLPPITASAWAHLKTAPSKRWINALFHLFEGMYGVRFRVSESRLLEFWNVYLCNLECGSRLTPSNLHIGLPKRLFVCVYVCVISGITWPLLSGSSVGNRLSCGSCYQPKRASWRGFCFNSFSSVSVPALI